MVLIPILRLKPQPIGSSRSRLVFMTLLKSRNPNLSEEEGLEQFISKISAGIDQGFGEARDVLDSLKRLDGKVKTDIDETYETDPKRFKRF